MDQVEERSPIKITPLSDWVLVKCDERKSRSKIIVDVGESPVRTGTVLEVGPGKYLTDDSSRRVPVGVEKGERVAFLRWHQEHRPGKDVVRSLADLSEQVGAEVFLIRQNDILFVFDGEVSVDLP